MAKSSRKRRRLHVSSQKNSHSAHGGKVSFEANVPVRVLVIVFFEKNYVIKQQQWPRVNLPGHQIFCALASSRVKCFKWDTSLQITFSLWFSEGYFSKVSPCICLVVLAEYFDASCLSSVTFFFLFSFRSVRWIHWRVLNIRNIIRKGVRYGCPCLCMFCF